MEESETFLHLEAVRTRAGLTETQGWQLPRILGGLAEITLLASLGVRALLRQKETHQWLVKFEKRSTPMPPPPPLLPPLPPPEPVDRSQLWTSGVIFRLNREAADGTRLVAWDAPPMEGTLRHELQNTEDEYCALDDWERTGL